MKFLCVCIAVSVCLLLSTTEARAGITECAAYIPAGVVIRVLPDEKLVAGSSSGPTLFTVTSDLRFFPNRPPLLARGAKVLGTILESKEAGHFSGKARFKITLTSILTSDLCEYPIDAKIIDSGRYRAKDEVVFGRGHAQRDLVALLFPPTTVYQLLRTPSRGPKLVLDNETALTIKLMQPVSLGNVSAANAALEGPILKPDLQRPEIQKSARLTPESCSVGEFTPDPPLIRLSTVLRPVRNLTPYYVNLYLDHNPVIILAPCYGRSVIATPATAFRLEATASLLTTGGQKQIGLKVVPSADGRGWDVVLDESKPVAFVAN